MIGETDNEILFGWLNGLVILGPSRTKHGSTCNCYIVDVSRLKISDRNHDVKKIW